MRPRKNTLKPEALSVYSEMFQMLPTRSQRRVIDILEGAIRNYATIGIEKTTYDSIAKACKVSRPLVQHYFKDKDELFEMAMKYIRANFQKIAVDAIKKESNQVDQLRQYVGALFTWIKKFPLHAKVWNLTYYYAAVDRDVRKVHTELAMMGHDRITAMLEAGVEAGVFAAGDLRNRAKLIQTLYTGGLIMVTSEDLYVDLDTYRQQLADGCLNIAQRN